MVKVTRGNVLSLIEEYGISLQPAGDDDSGGNPYEVMGWEAFPCYVGGCWQEASTVVGVVQEVVKAIEEGGY